jgi:hypothetical protein
VIGDVVGGKEEKERLQKSSGDAKVTGGIRDGACSTGFAWWRMNV